MRKILVIFIAYAALLAVFALIVYAARGAIVAQVDSADRQSQREAAREAARNIRE